MNEQGPESETETGAATSDDQFSARLGNIGRRGFLQRIMDSLYGYDYFISYKWTDGRIYALALAEQLQKKGFTCFLDSEDYLKGDNWKSVGERALQKTTRLVLVGSPEVHQSDPVLRELKVFTATGKSVIPINFDESLTGPGSEQSPLARYLDSDGIWIGEAMERLSQGPSSETVEGLQKSFTKQRQSQKRARALRIVACVFGVLMIGLGWVGYKKYQGETTDYVNQLTSAQVAGDASADSFKSLLDKMTGRPGSIVGELDYQREKFPFKWDGTKDRDDTDDGEVTDDSFAKRRANAAIVLLHFYQADSARKYLARAKDYLDLDGRPEPLAQFAARCREPGCLDRKTLIEFAEYLIEDNDSYNDRSFSLAGYSALLCVGEYPDPSPNDFAGKLEKWYLDHPSAAIHSACAWLLGREEGGRDVVARLNEQLVEAQQGPVSLEPVGKDWFVVKLEPEAEDAPVNQPVEYITFVLFKRDQDVFAVADRETTVGICHQLGASRAYKVLDENLRKVDSANVDLDPANNVDFAMAKQVCEEFSKRLPKTLQAHLPDQSQWASAWGNPTEDERRVFQFGRDSLLLPRYAKVGASTTGLSRPGQVAVHQPSMTGMFDMHGNVAEWTIDGTAEGRRRGGAVGQDSELCQWNNPIQGGTHKGFRFCLSAGH